MISTVHILLDDSYSYTFYLMMNAVTTHFCLMMIATVHFLLDDCYSYTFYLMMIAVTTHFCLMMIANSYTFYLTFIATATLFFVPSVSECDLLRVRGCLSIRSQYMDHICCSIMGRVTWRCSIC